MAFQTGIAEENELHQRLIAMVDAMPAFPKSIHQIMTMSADINCSPRDLVKVIESDPVMTMKILKLVNSAFFALSRNVSSVHHALVYLGMNTIKNLAVSIATVSALPTKSIPELPMSSFLTHSLGTACVAQRLAKQYLHLRDVSDHFVAGLLHGFGKAVLIQFEPVVYAKILQQARMSGRLLAHVEIEEIGISYAEVGAMLAENWQLPPVLVDCIRMHVVCDEDSSDLTICVAASKSVVNAMKLGDSGDPDVDAFPDFICRRLGSDLETVITQMQDLPDEIHNLQGLVSG